MSFHSLPPTAGLRKNETVWPDTKRDGVQSVRNFRPASNKTFLACVIVAASVVVIGIACFVAYRCYLRKKRRVARGDVERGLPTTTAAATTTQESGDLTSNSPSDSSTSTARDIRSPESHPSTLTHGSAQDDHDAFSDVYIWGEVVCDNSVMAGADSRADVLVPKPLASNEILDVHHMAFGEKHAALVPRQGNLFTWGEESGGRLGHGVERDVIQPLIVESLALSTVESVSCGKFHTCAVTMSGEVYTWGDGKHNAGLLGHGTHMSHWIPKRISAPLDGLQVASVACGPWHTALLTSTGRLFTFGDGSFGVLGHGNNKSVPYPREIESLMGMKTISVGCGVWHTAAVVQMTVAQTSTSISAGKLFTWGDGDENRLGHGDKEPRLRPTCVCTAIGYNFQKIACGNSLTVGLTTSGNVVTMGSTVYGQLGNRDWNLPCVVEGTLMSEVVEDIACGAYHVAVLTSKNKVYTWGKGANGQLGHGDIEDIEMPKLVETLKDKHVKFISCGSNFSAAICLHK